MKKQTCFFKLNKLFVSLIEHPSTVRLICFAELPIFYISLGHIFKNDYCSHRYSTPHPPTQFHSLILFPQNCQTVRLGVFQETSTSFTSTSTSSSVTSTVTCGCCSHCQGWAALLGDLVYDILGLSIAGICR